MMKDWHPEAGEITIEERATECPTILFCSWFCPYAQRAWISLEEKGVPYQYVEITPYKEDSTKLGGLSKNPLSLDEKVKKYPDFARASPHGLVPAVKHLRDDGITDRVHDSLVVCEYLDDAFPAAPFLLPRDPGTRARVRNSATDISQRVLPCFYKMLMAETNADQEFQKEALLKGFLSFAKGMDAPGASNAFFLGDTFSLADIAAAPWFERTLSVGAAYRGMTIPRNVEHSRLWQWYDSCLARPSFAKTLVSPQRLIMNYSGYADGSATSDVAKTLVGKDSSRAKL